MIQDTLQYDKLSGHNYVTSTNSLGNPNWKHGEATVTKLYKKAYMQEVNRQRAIHSACSTPGKVSVGALPTSHSASQPGYNCTVNRTSRQTHFCLRRKKSCALFHFLGKYLFSIESDKSLQQWCCGILVIPPPRSLYADTRTPTPGTERAG